MEYADIPVDSKFSKDNEIYFSYIDKINSTNLSAQDLIYDFTSYVGSVNLARFLTFFECFQKVKGISGDIADVGTYKAASLLAFAKLIQIFEPHSQTRVHGYDWWKGQKPGLEDNEENSEKYVAIESEVRKLIDMQGLDKIALINSLDLVSHLGDYFETRPQLRFKLVFLDCGIKNVLESSMKFFWPRLASGGILLLDHYNNFSSPSESSVIDSYIDTRKVYQFDYSRSPSAYIIK